MCTINNFVITSKTSFVSIFFTKILIDNFTTASVHVIILYMQAMTFASSKHVEDSSWATNSSFCKGEYWYIYCTSRTNEFWSIDSYTLETYMKIVEEGITGLVSGFLHY